MRNRRKSHTVQGDGAAIALHSSAAIMALHKGDADEVERRLLLIHDIADRLAGPGPIPDYANLANAVYGAF